MAVELAPTDSGGASEPRAAPRASIITATYNRGNVLRIVIETVRRQAVTDWEWIEWPVVSQAIEKVAFWPGKVSARGDARTRGRRTKAAPPRDDRP